VNHANRKIPDRLAKWIEDREEEAKWIEDREEEAKWIEDREEEDATSFEQHNVLPDATEAAELRRQMQLLELPDWWVNGAPRPPEIVKTDVTLRLDEMPLTPFHWRLLLTLAISWASVGLQVALMDSLGSAHLTPALTFSLFGTALGALVFGRLADRFGRRFVFLVSLVLCALGTAFSAFSSDVTILEIFRFTAGIGVGGQYVAMNAILQELMPAPKRGRVCLAVYGSFWLGPVFGALLLPLGWQIAFGVSEALCAVVWLLFRRVPESPRWLVAQGRTEAADSIVKEIEGSLADGGAARLPVPASVLIDTRLSRPTVTEVLEIMWHEHRPTLVVCFVLMAVQAFFYNAFCFGNEDVLTQHFKSVAAQSGVDWHMLSIAFGNFLGPVVLGWLVDGKDGRRWTMAVTFLVSGVLLSVTGLFWLLDQVFDAGYFTAAYFTVAWTVIFFFASAAASTAYLTTGEVFPLEIRNLAFAVVFFLSMLVGSLSPWLFTWVLGSPFGITVAYLFAALLMVLVGSKVLPIKRRPTVDGVWGVLYELLRKSWIVSWARLPEPSGQPVVHRSALPAAI
jgi:MFS family permease